jgi:hypothetical protein
MKVYGSVSQIVFRGTPEFPDVKMRISQGISVAA